MRHPIRNMIFVLMLVAVGFGVFISSTAFKLHKQAALFLSDLITVQGSKDPTVGFEMVKKRYGNMLQPIEGCLPQDCQYLITISNRRISALHLVSYAELKVWYTVYKGSLIFALAEYRVALSGENSPVVHVQVGMCAHRCGVRFDVNPHGSSQQMWNGIVEFDTRATREQRNAALALDLDCLTGIKRCTDVSELLPSIWYRTGPATVQNRLVGFSQDLEESHRLTSPYE